MTHSVSRVPKSNHTACVVLKPPQVSECRYWDGSSLNRRSERTKHHFLDLCFKKKFVSGSISVPPVLERGP